MNFKIPLSKPDISELEAKAVGEVLKTSRLSLGPNVVEFEKRLAQLAQVSYAVATNSGTAALHLIIRALNIAPGDEVITTPFSFISSSNCFVYEKAKPVFVDIDEKTFNIDTTKIEKAITPKTKVILAVDVFGLPADWENLERIAKKHSLFLIEDSAEAIGAEYKGRKCGSFGNAAIFSFYPNKQITTGEGGVILTNDKKIADYCRSSVNQGRKLEGEEWLWHERLGYNYRLNEMSSALGIAQLKRFSEIMEKRDRTAQFYLDFLKDEPALELPDPLHSWFVFVVKLERKLGGEKRDQIISYMAEKGIQCRPYFYPIHLQPFYRNEFGFNEGDFPVCEDIAGRTIALPFFGDLQREEIEFVSKNLKEAVRL